MSNLNEQISLVTQTMFESVDYMKNAIKNNDVNEFLPIFISLVESVQILSPILKEQFDEQTVTLITTIEKEIINCTKSLESADFSSILTSLQFTLEPSLRTLNEAFQNTKSNEIENETPTSIGMFYAPNNPILSYGVERMKAELEEAKRQNCKIYFFESKDVDIENETINARISIENEDREIIGLPDVIYNIFPKINWNQDSTEKWLRKKVPFTTFPIDDKVKLPRKLIRETQLGYLFIPFIAVDNMDRVLHFFKSNKKGVFKRAAAARGENIFFVEQKNQDRFVIEVDKKPLIMNLEGFTNWVTKFLIPDYYILQEYREFKTRGGNPYDFRAHMQKDGEGKWQLTRIYPRIGSKKGILSNISRGGYSQKFKEFLYEEFPEQQAEQYFIQLQQLAFEIINEIDRIYSYSLHEVGIDLAIAKDGRVYMHEANPVPQSKYHEKERAINAIAYAKYLAKNKLFLSNSLQQQPAFTNQFFYKQHPNIEIVDLDKSKVTIGLLYEEKLTSDKYLEACAIMAPQVDANFFAFRIQDIDYEHKVIKGRFLNNFVWQEKIVRYPDVIIDRLRKKNSGNYNLAYEEFKHIPFSHNLDTKNLDKVKIMNEFVNIEEIKPFVIPYLEDVTEQSLSDFIDQHESIMLKPKDGSFAIGIIKLTKQGNRFVWSEDKKQIEYSWTQIKRLCTERDIYNLYLVQKYVESKSIAGNVIDIRIHKIKDNNDHSKWCLAHEYVRISNHDFKINTQLTNDGFGFKGSITNINQYIQENFPANYKDITTKVWDSAQQIIDAYNNLHNSKIHEQVLNLALTLDGDLFILNINANRPSVTGYEYQVARYLIPFVKSLAPQNVTVENN